MKNTISLIHESDKRSHSGSRGGFCSSHRGHGFCGDGQNG